MRSSSSDFNPIASIGDELAESQSLLFRPVGEAHDIESDHQFSDARELPLCPEQDAGLISKLLISWLTPFIWKSYGTRLGLADLYRLGPEYGARWLKEKIQQAWMSTSRSQAKAAFPYYWALSAAFGTKFYLSGVLRILVDITSMVSPFLMRLLIEDMSDREQGIPIDQRIGYLLCLIMFLVQTVRTLSVNYYLTTVNTVAMQVRTATTTLIYEKMTKLSGLTKQRFSSGHIVTLMSTDAAKLELATIYFHYLWSGIFQIIVSMLFLYNLLGWCSLVGFSFFAVFLPIQGRLLAWLTTYRKETAMLTDKRVKLLQEILMGIKIIKFYAWERAFLRKIDKVRQDEMKRIAKLQFTRAFISAVIYAVPISACMATFLMCVLANHSLTADIVFPAVAYYNLLRVPLMTFPKVISITIDAKVALGRIEEFLQAEEISFNPLCKPDSIFGIQVTNAEFTWEKSFPVQQSFSLDRNATSGNTAAEDRLDEQAVLKKAKLDPPFVHQKSPSMIRKLVVNDLKIPKGALAAVIGPVGSGKSSLLNALLGEMEWKSGSIIFGGEVGYCGQQAWVQNSTFRDNITFGLPFDSERYEKTLYACALEKDILSLPDGDLTEVGERGVSLSGGQKQRLSLARATYSYSNILLLDDPLSAVDAQVRRHLFDNCLCGILAGRTRVLVTSQLQLLPYVDYVVIMEEQRVTKVGTFEELMYQSPDFADLMHKHGGVDVAEWEASTIGGHRSIDSSRGATPGFMSAGDLTAIEFAMGVGSSEKAERKSNFNLRRRRVSVVPVEQRNYGAVAIKTYIEYLLCCGGRLFIGLTSGSILMVCLMRIVTDVWLSFWVSNPPKFDLSTKVYVLVYIFAGLCQSLVNFGNGLIFAKGGLEASRRMHQSAVKHLLFSPIRYFEATPSGRILNRFSKDQDIIDNQLSDTLCLTISIVAANVTTLIMISILSWGFIIPTAILLVFYGFIQQYYRYCSGELDRLEALLRSPVYMQFTEALAGSSVIRTYNQQVRFTEANYTAIDTNNQPIFLQLSIQRWLRVRLEMISNVLMVCAAIASYVFRVPSSLAGLAIGYALGLTNSMIWLVRQLVDIDTQIISSERLSGLTNLEMEKRKILNDSEEEKTDERTNDRLDKWPQQGRIEFKNYTMTYRPELFPVLRDINLMIEPGEKIGIVGRTGAGKSSLLVALFRFVEPLIGSIWIDEVNIQKVELDDLRMGMCIIPQEPIVFSGTIRSNLDPMEGGYTDEELWRALDRVYMRDVVLGMSGKLDSKVYERGENLSIGHRQLLCLARAILKQSRILILDEATATIDLETDECIQNTIRKEFMGCTILTIAHRIHTVLDYDKILVLDQGQVVEYDRPSNLLKNPKSELSMLLRASD